MTTFIISDTHFGHENIIRLCNRPFQSVEEMNETMISSWNTVVRPNDEVYHLGDFAFHDDDPGKHFRRLNGKKYLIKGNHDYEDTFKLPWERIWDYRTIRFNKKKIVLFHYPIWEWDGFYHGSWHLYGHIHTVDMAKNYIMAKDIPVYDSNVETRWRDIGKNSMNMCVEHHNYTPVSLEEIEQKIGK